MIAIYSHFLRFYAIEVYFYYCAKIAPIWTNYNGIIAPGVGTAAKVGKSAGQSAPKIGKTGTPAEVRKASAENNNQGEFITNYEISPKSTLNFQNFRSEILILEIIHRGYQNILQ